MDRWERCLILLLFGIFLERKLEECDIKDKVWCYRFVNFRILEVDLGELLKVVLIIYIIDV